jgi:hypothetical protein
MAAMQQLITNRQSGMGQRRICNCIRMFVTLHIINQDTDFV